MTNWPFLSTPLDFRDKCHFTHAHFHKVRVHKPVIMHNILLLRKFLNVFWWLGDSRQSALVDERVREKERETHGNPKGNNVPIFMITLRNDYDNAGVNKYLLERVSPV